MSIKLLFLKLFFPKHHLLTRNRWEKSMSIRERIERENEHKSNSPSSSASSCIEKK